MIVKYSVNFSDYGVQELIVNKETPKQYQFKNHDRINKSKTNIPTKVYGDYVYIDTKGLEERVVKEILDNMIQQDIDALEKRYLYNRKKLQQRRDSLK